MKNYKGPMPLSHRQDVTEALQRGFTEQAVEWYNDGRCPVCGVDMLVYGDEFIDERMCDPCGESLYGATQEG
jgi:hypothetical protein